MASAEGGAIQISEPRIEGAPALVVAGVSRCSPWMATSPRCGMS